jgi:UDP-N-acetylmuramoyl-tripeptide--D-alanyl-D-alanine ligase
MSHWDVLLVAPDDRPANSRLAGVLARAGCRVALLGDPKGIVAHSRYVAERIACPYEPAALIDALSAAVHRLGTGGRSPWVIFTDETGLSAAADALANKPEPWLIDLLPTSPERLDLIRSKSPFVTAARGVVTIPRTEVVTSRDQAITAAQAMGFPVILKSSAGMGGRHVRQARFSTEAGAMFDDLTSHGPVLVQEFVAGRLGATGLLYDHGEPVAWINAYVPQTWPGPFGPSCVRRFFVDPALEQIARDLGRLMRFHGFCGFDWIQENLTGTYKVLEFNGRPTPGYHLGHVSGVDFSMAVAAMLKGERLVQRPMPPTRRPSVYLFPEHLTRCVNERKPLGLIRWLPFAARHDVPWDDPALLTRYVPRIARFAARSAKNFAKRIIYAGQGSMGGSHACDPNWGVYIPHRAHVDGEPAWMRVPMFRAAGAAMAKAGRLRGLLASYPGQNEFLWRLNHKIWNPMLKLASIHRRTISRWTRVVGIAGSYGKTTTTRTVTAALGLPQHPLTELNANCFALVPWALLRTFPPRRYAVAEFGAGAPGEMTRYTAAMRPDIAVMTSMGSEHIQSFRDQEHLAYEEAAAVRLLSPHGKAILNGDDPGVTWMASQTEARVITFGFDPSCEVRGSDYAIDWPRGSKFTVHVNGESHAVRCRMIGKFNVYPVLAAIAVAYAEGRPIAPAIGELESLPPTPGRAEPMRLASGAWALRDDFKATIDTVHSGLDILAEIPAKRRWVVMGDLELPPKPVRLAYRQVGEHVGRVADYAVFVGEHARDYRPSAKQAGLKPENVFLARWLHEAVEILRLHLGPGDVVLVKGRHMQRMSRLILALQGRKVRCKVDPCRMHLVFCEKCPMLGVDWNPYNPPTIHASQFQ